MDNFLKSIGSLTKPKKESKFGWLFWLIVIIVFGAAVYLYLTYLQ